MEFSKEKTKYEVKFTSAMKKDMKEGERIANNPNVKGYSFNEFVEEKKKW